MRGKMLKLALSAAVLLPPLSVSAQQGLNSTVRVTRDYEARLMAGVKPPLPVRYADSLNRFNLSFRYDFSERPYRDLYEFSPMGFADFREEGRAVYPVFYAKALISYPWAPEADVYLQPRLRGGWSLLAYGGHRSFWGVLPGLEFREAGRQLDRSNAVNYGDWTENRAGMRIGYAWRKGELSAGTDYEGGSRSFYGLEHGLPALPVGTPFHTLDHAYLRDSLSRRYDRWTADFALRSKNPDRTAFYYDVAFRYALTRERNRLFAVPGFGRGLQENLFHTKAAFGVTVNRIHKVQVGVRSVHSDCLSGNGLLELTPRYRYERGRWTLDAGLTLAGTYAGSGANLKAVPLYPVFSVHFEAWKDALWIYGAADGENRLNTLEVLSEAHPWLTPEAEIRVSRIPLRFEAGIRGVLFDVLSYDLGLSYAWMRDLAMLAPDPFRPVAYADASRLRFKAGMMVRTQSFDAGVDLNFSSYRRQDSPGQHLWMMPGFEGQAFARYNLRERFVFSVDARFRNAAYGWIGAADAGKECLVPGFVDLQARVTYVVNRKLSVFLQGKNLADMTVQYVPGYAEPEINFGAGLYVRF